MGWIGVICGIRRLVRSSATLHNAHSHTFREVPAVAGLALLAPGEYVVAYVLGCGIALLISKQRGVKLFFNLSMFLLEATFGSAVYHALVGAVEPDEPRAWLAAFAAVVVTDLFSALAVTMAISAAENHLDREVLRDALGPGLAAAVVNTCMALLVIVLLLNQPAALPLAGAVLAVLTVAYRAHVRLNAGYSRLQHLYQFVGSAERPADLEEAVATVLADARRLLRSEGAELVVLPTPDHPGLRRTMSDAGTVVVTNYPGFAAEADAWWAPAALGEPVLRTRALSSARRPQPLPAGKLDDSRGAGPRDGMAAPLFTEGRVHAVLLVTERSFHAETFTREDMLLFETLAGHAAVALDKVRLVDSLLRVAAEREHEARHDTLTGLPNRRAFTEALDVVIAGSGRGAVLFLDLDDFKDINDTLGHDAGDTVLQRIGERLSSACEGVVARFGGDEFAVLLPDVSADEALDSGYKLHDAASRPVPLHLVTLVTKMSVGVALLPEHGADTNEILRHADVAMYGAKAAGGGVEMYRPEDGQAVARKLVLAADLPAAVERGEFEVYYQPQADALTGRMVGAEALLRWQHPTYDFVPPPEIIAVAERVGCLRRLTDGVLQRALRQRAIWAAHGFDLSLSVNVTVTDLSDEGLPAAVASSLIASTGSADKLTLEITEQGVMKDPDRCLAVLDRLHELGVQLAVDDFGTGYSSLAYLDRLPVQEVKIDKSFVQRIGKDGSNDTVVRSTVTLAHDLGMRVVAEGVETNATWRQIADLGCEMVQGYALARPLAASDFLTWLQDASLSAVHYHDGAGVSVVSERTAAQ